MKRRVRSLSLWVLFCCLSFATGCGYRLGSSLPSDIRTVHVPAFANKSGEPLVENDASKAMIEELQRDGTLRMSSSSDADSVLEVTLVSLKLEPLAYNPDDRKTANEYRLRLTADYVFKRAKTGEVLVRRKATGETTFVFAGDLVSAKRDNMGKAAQDLARNIATGVVEYW